jgi:hypothetical protein
VNITRTPWTVVSSLPIPDTTYPKKETMSPQGIQHCRLPHSPKYPGTDVGEDTHHQKPHKITVEDAQKALLPPCDETEHIEKHHFRETGDTVSGLQTLKCLCFHQDDYEGNVRGNLTLIRISQYSLPTLDLVCGNFPLVLKVD